MKIKSVKKIDYDGDVFNLRIKTDTETNHNYFANNMCVSNCHHSSNASIRKIITMCQNAKYKIGLTGTLPKAGTCNSFTIQSYLGPTVFRLTSHHLIESGHATPVEVKCYEMDYLDSEVKRKLFELRDHPDKDGNKLLNLEKQIMRSNRERMVFVCKEIAKCDNNALVLFADVQGEYGRNIYNWLRSNTDDKTIYYIDGNTKSENREYIKAEMEANSNVILVASIGTFSEGISIKNLHYIYLSECGKSEIISAQILGRGMRLFDCKEKVIVVDFVDNYCYGTNPYKKNNYLYRHGLERQQIYEDRKFPYTVEKITI